MKHILLPTDFSQNAKNAMVYALQLYKDSECTFYLLHSYVVPVYYSSQNETINPYMTSLVEQYQQESMDRLLSLKAEMETTYPNPKHQYVIHAVYGEPVEEIGEMVQKQDIDIVVMGTKGATGARELLFGSNTVRAIKKTRCPLIAVPENFGYEPPKEILFPTDYEVPFHAGILKELLFLSKVKLARINVLHIATGYELITAQKENRERLERLLKPYSHLLHETRINDIIKGINDFQLKNKVNLLAMVMNKHTFLENLFVRPVIRKIGMHLHIPFMVIPYLDR